MRSCSHTVRYIDARILTGVVSVPGTTDRSIIVIHAMIIGIITVLCVLMLPWIYGFSLFPDEFGYWATAANAIGWDWAPVASIGSYYSFGYGWILTPILVLFRDPIISYRAAVILNLLCQILGYVLLCDTGKRLMPHADDRSRVILCGIAATYPAWSFYTQMTMSESIMFCLYILSVWCMMRYLEKPALIRMIGLFAVLGFMCCVHMRTVGALIAAVMVIIIRALVQSGTSIRREKLIGGIAIGIAVAVVALCVWRDIRMQHLSSLYGYATESDIAVNSMSGQIGKIKGLLSLRGIGMFIASLSGKLLYLGCASFGMAYIGFHALAGETLDGIRGHFAGRWGTSPREMSDDPSNVARLYLTAYVILASIGQILITTIYLIGSASANSDRLDLYLHGRYDDYIIPILMVYGIYRLMEHQGRRVRETAVAAMIMIVLVVIAMIVINANNTGMRNPHRELMIGMSYLARDAGRQSDWYVPAEVGLAIAVMLLIWVTVRVYCRSKVVLWLIAIIVIQAVLAYVSSDTMIRRGQGNIYGDIQLSGHLAEQTAHRHGRIVDIYEDGDVEYIDVIQFCLRDETVVPITVRAEETLDTAALSTDDYVLVDWESQYRPLLDEMYEYGYEMGHFALYHD